MAGRGRRDADDLLMSHLAGGRTVQEAARLARVSERTAHRRLKEPEFVRRLEGLRAEMVRTAAHRLAAAMNHAADGLLLLLRADSEQVRLGACRSILEFGVKLRESVEFEARLAALEEAQQGGTP